MRAHAAVSLTQGQTRSGWQRRAVYWLYFVLFCQIREPRRLWQLQKLHYLQRKQVARLNCSERPGFADLHLYRHEQLLWLPRLQQQLGWQLQPAVVVFAVAAEL